MKSMTYAQKADLVAKCKRVFKSMKRSNQLASAKKYEALAIKAVGDEYEIASAIRQSFSDAERRIKNKPRYRYNNKAGEWVECKARNFYNHINSSEHANAQRQMQAQDDAMRRSLAYGANISQSRLSHPVSYGSIH